MTFRCPRCHGDSERLYMYTKMQTMGGGVTLTCAKCGRDFPMSEVSRWDIRYAGEMSRYGMTEDGIVCEAMQFEDKSFYCLVCKRHSPFGILYKNNDDGLVHKRNVT